MHDKVSNDVTHKSLMPKRKREVVAYTRELRKKFLK